MSPIYCRIYPFYYDVNPSVKPRTLEGRGSTREHVSCGGETLHCYNFVLTPITILNTIKSPLETFNADHDVTLTMMDKTLHSLNWYSR